MNQDWNTNNRDAYEPGQRAAGHELEQPGIIDAPVNQHERADTLASSGAYSQSPFDYLPPAKDQTPLLSDSTQILNNQRLSTLRKRPAAKLLAGSLLSLQTWQMDLDCPPTLRNYVKAKLSSFLLENRAAEPADKNLSPDELFINFVNDTHPAIEVDGREQYAIQLSLSNLAMASFEARSYLALIKCVEPDRSLDESAPLLTTDRVMDFIKSAHWEREYCTLLEEFWATHEATYCVLARLAFVDGLSRQYVKRTITLEGYTLALDMLGLDRFPTSLASLQHPVSGERTLISLLSINGRTVPGIFQLKSRVTNHCFIHVLGETPTTVEYISRDQDGNLAKWLEALNSTGQFGLLTQHVQLADISEQSVDGDLFAALTDAQKNYSLEVFAAQPLEANLPEDDADNSILFKPIERALALAGALDLWQPQPDVSMRIPDHIKIAQRLMRSELVKHHQLNMLPDTVFIRYLRGTSTTPMGSAHSPVTYVHTPDEKPINLTNALLTNYRVDRPVGYLDNGGRSVVYSDPTAQGVYTESAELAISADTLESLIKGIDLLAVMTRRFEDFWSLNAAAIDQSLSATFNAEAVIALKLGHISRAGFNLLVRARAIPITQSDVKTPLVTVKSLGFYLKPSLTEGVHCECCAGLLVFTDPTLPLILLYQAGQSKALLEFKSSEELGRHIEQAAADEQWRNTLLNYVPASQHEKLTYVLEVWAGQRIPDAPGSLLRPWTDVIYANHLHKAKSRTLCEQPLTSSPFVFMRQTLARNFIANASDRIVTSKEVTLRYWTRQFNHLQLLLAPMSLLITPAMVASALVHAGSVYLSIEKSRLPGNRDTEKIRALLNALSLGLLQLAPFTHGLLRGFSRLTRWVKPLKAAGKMSLSPRTVSVLLTRFINVRETRLQLFFGTTRLLKTWKVAGNTFLGTFGVQAWKLDSQLLLWTSHQAQARTLVVSTHGYYLPWTKTTAIPNGTELRFYAPHGYALVDPSLHKVVAQKVEAFSVSDAASNRLASQTFSPLAITDKLLAGTSLRGNIKNYSIAKFQGPAGESYQEISRVVHYSNLPPWHAGELPAVPMDVLTVRNRFAMATPTLQGVFKTLSEHGIHYDRILLLHCRCDAISAALGRSPVYTAPLNGARPPSPGPGPGP